MKILFLLDIINDKQGISVPNGRALEVLAHQLQLKQTGPAETWLAFPMDEKGHNRESDGFVPLVRFPVALKPLRGANPVAKKNQARKATVKK